VHSHQASNNHEKPGWCLSFREDHISLLANMYFQALKQLMQPDLSDFVEDWQTFAELLFMLSVHDVVLKYFGLPT
jgi:hypothetical protein